MMENKHDLSVAMAQANVIVLFISLPVVILQFVVFLLLHGIEGLDPAWSTALLIIAVLLGIVIHELIHSGNGDLFWFSLVRNSAAGGDWLIRNIKAGMQVEDHPTNAGCYVSES